MEHMAHTLCDRLPIVITRPFNYTGAGQGGQFLIPKLVDHFARNAPSIELGNLDVEREFNDVRMVCEDYLALLLHGQSGQTYNICTGTTYTLRQVIDTLTQITGQAIQVQVNPALVRESEVIRLCGNPAKLQELLGKHGIQRVQLSLKQTLKIMLAEQPAQTAL
jgi:nucleoside-diphosphate-sugar epimerase